MLIGSSLGGLTAARVAEGEPRVKALVLLAPAFQLVERWREALGPAWDDWQRTGWREVTDYTTGGPRASTSASWRTHSASTSTIPTPRARP